MMLADFLTIAGLYAAVNYDDWTWFPLLTISFMKRRTPVWLGYVLASALLYFACYGLARLAGELPIERIFGDATVSVAVGGIFIALGVYRFVKLFDRRRPGDDPDAHASRKNYPFGVAMLAVVANGYNNILVLTPAFAAVGPGKGLVYALALPCFNFLFASALLVAIHVFEARTLSFTNRYAAPIGTVAMTLLGLKIVLQA